jgi:hypothetical protein
MPNNVGRFAWIAEPRIKNGKPVLQYHEEAQTTILDEQTLDEVVDKLNQWFDAMPVEEGNAACGKCGTVLYGESPSCAASDLKPCPRCGSTTRSFAVRASDQIRLSAAIQLEAVTYPQSLLENAKNLIKAEQYNEAVVIAHLACEIAAERAFAQAIATKRNEAPKGTVDGLPPGYNVANDQIRERYTALTGDDIKRQPFWQAFKQFVTRRNQIVHGTKTVSRAEAEAPLKAASSLVRHLNR